MPTILSLRLPLPGLARLVLPFALAAAVAAAVGQGTGVWAAAVEAADHQSEPSPVVGALAQAQQQPSAQQVQLANIVARVCPTLEACQQGLAQLLLRLNTQQQQLLASQEEVRQLKDLLAEAGSANQRQTQEDTTQLAQQRDEALVQLAEAARSASEQAKEIQRLNAEVASLESQVRQLQFRQPNDNADDQGEPALLRPLTQDDELARLRIERDALRSEVRKLNEQLSAGASGSTPRKGNASLARAAELELDRLRTEVARLTGDNRRQQQENMNASARIDRLQQSLNDAQMDLAVLSRERDELRAQLGKDVAPVAESGDQGLRSRDAMIDRIGTLESELEQARLAIAGLEAAKQDLEAQLASQALQVPTAPTPDPAGVADLEALSQNLQAVEADKAALERQLIKLETDRRSNREDIAQLTQAVQQRDQAILELREELGRMQAQAQNNATQQAEAALQAEKAARAEERADYERLLAELGEQNQQLEQTLAALRATSDDERRGLVAEITRLSNELKQLREFVDLQQVQSGDQQDAVARLTRALEDAQQKHSAQLDLLGRAEIEIEALLADLNTARAAASDSQAQRQKAIDDALELRRLLDELIQDRDQLARQVATLRQTAEQQTRQQDQLAASQKAFREVEADRDRLRGLLAEKQREAQELSRQLQRRQAVIDSQTAVGRNYDLLVGQLNDAEAELVLARMQISALEQRLQGLGQPSSTGEGERAVLPAPLNLGAASAGASGQAGAAVPAQSGLQAGRQNTATPQTPQTPQTPELQADPDIDARTLRLLDELRRIGR